RAARRADRRGPRGRDHDAAPGTRALEAPRRLGQEVRRVTVRLAQLRDDDREAGPARPCRRCRAPGPGDALTVRRRLAVCYVAPGSHLVASAGPTRNVLALASALGERADVSVAFRSAPDVPAGLDVPVLEIEPGVRPKTVGDDSAVRGISYREFIAYLHALRRFARERLRSLDLVLEKNWLLTG